MDDIDHKIELKGMAQPSSSTCWLASYKMILKAAGKPHSDEVIREKFKLFNIDFQDALDNGLDGKDWATAAFALGFAPMIPLQYRMDGGAFDRAVGRTIGQKAFLAVLAKGPLWIGRIVGANKSHAIIARGFSSWENKIIWVNPQNEANDNAFESRSKLDLFINMIASPMGAVQFRAA